MNEGALGTVVPRVHSVSSLCSVVLLNLDRVLCNISHLSINPLVNFDDKCVYWIDNYVNKLLP